MKNNLILFLKGFAMGSADVVPGVSGGTIAFITGIYDELISTLGNINLSMLKLILKGDFKGFWIRANLKFLLVLFFGILTSIFTLAGVISYLLKYHPEPLWAFFFGLVTASIFYIGKTIDKWDVKVIISFVLGALIAFMITIAPPVKMSDNIFYVFISGAIAICAMILPGISGSFILLLMGSYSTIIFAVKDKNLLLLTVFGSGCAVGLLLFSKLLKWLFTHYEKIIVSILTGFLLGSLNKLWPWKINTDQLLVVHTGGDKEFIQNNVIPNFDSEFLGILLCVFFGFGLLFSLEFAARKLSQ